MNDTDMFNVLQSMTIRHRHELAELGATLVLWRKHMEDNGLEPPTIHSSEALTRFRHAFEVAGLNDDLQHNELLADWWIKAKAAA